MAEYITDFNDKIGEKAPILLAIEKYTRILEKHFVRYVTSEELCEHICVINAIIEWNCLKIGQIMKKFKILYKFIW